MSKTMLLDHKLRNGWVTLEREDKGGESRLLFRVQLDSDYPAELIFEQLVLGLTDSANSWLWPIEYEESPERPEGGVREGCKMRMTYRVPRFDKPEIPAKPVTYSYWWPQYKPGECLLEYQSLDHPLKGGAVVQVLPLGEGRSRLSWDGAYTFDPAQSVVIESMKNYIPFLYEKFEDNMDAGPPAN